MTHHKKKRVKLSLTLGGFFRGIASLVKPAFRSVGSSLVRAATSDTAKAAARSLGRQALESSLNMTKDLLEGNSMSEGLDREKESFKKNLSSLIGQQQTRLKRQQIKKRKKGGGAAKTRKVLKMQQFENDVM